jgi:hypothetical protein
VVPLAIIFLLFQAFFLKLPGTVLPGIVIGTLLACAGLFVFLLGVEVAFLPFGRAIGEALGSRFGTWTLAAFGFVLGFVTTWGEPAVRILADQVDEASTGSIRHSWVVSTVCFGVAISVGIGMLRIGYGIPILYVLVPGYALALVIMWLSDEAFVSIAIDAGGVATGPLANSFLLALAFGVSSAKGDLDVFVHGLGMVALVALAPVLSVMALGVLVRGKARSKETR